MDTTLRNIAEEINFDGFKCSFCVILNKPCFDCLPRPSRNQYLEIIDKEPSKNDSKKRKNTGLTMAELESCAEVEGDKKYIPNITIKDDLIPSPKKMRKRKWLH